MLTDSRTLRSDRALVTAGLIAAIVLAAPAMADEILVRGKHVAGHSWELDTLSPASELRLDPLRSLIGGGDIVRLDLAAVASVEQISLTLVEVTLRGGAKLVGVAAGRLEGSLLGGPVELSWSEIARAEFALPGAARPTGLGTGLRAEGPGVADLALSCVGVHETWTEQFGDHQYRLREETSTDLPFTVLRSKQPLEEWRVPLALVTRLDVFRRHMVLVLDTPSGHIELTGESGANLTRPDGEARFDGVDDAGTWRLSPLRLRWPLRGLDTAQATIRFSSDLPAAAAPVAPAIGSCRTWSGHVIAIASTALEPLSVWRDGTTTRIPADQVRRVTFRGNRWDEWQRESGRPDRNWPVADIELVDGTTIVAPLYDIFGTLTGQSRDGLSVVVSTLGVAEFRLD